MACRGCLLESIKKSSVCPQCGHKVTSRRLRPAETLANIASLTDSCRRALLVADGANIQTQSEQLPPQ
jgi:hypothetical protein